MGFYVSVKWSKWIRQTHPSSKRKQAFIHLLILRAKINYAQASLL